MLNKTVALLSFALITGACANSFDQTPARQMSQNGVLVISAHHDLAEKSAHNRTAAPRSKALMTHGPSPHRTEKMRQSMSVGLTIAP